MSRTIVLNSSHWQPAKRAFVYNLMQPMKLDGYNVGIAAASIYNSFPNISSAMGNNTFSFVFPGYFAFNPETGASITPVTSWTFTWVIPDGYYSCSDINYFFQFKCQQYGLFITDALKSAPSYFLEFTVNSTLYAATINYWLVAQNASSSYVIPSNARWTWQPVVTPTTPSLVITTLFGKLLGFSAGTYGNSTSSFDSSSVQCPVINPISSLIIGTNLVNNHIMVIADSILSTALTAGYGRQININSAAVLYATVEPNIYSTIEITIRDNNMNLLNLYDSEATITLSLLEPPKSLVQEKSTNMKLF